MGEQHYSSFIFLLFWVLVFIISTLLTKLIIWASLRPLFPTVNSRCSVRVIGLPSVSTPFLPFSLSLILLLTSKKQIPRGGNSTISLEISGIQWGNSNYLNAIHLYFKKKIPCCTSFGNAFSMFDMLN